MGKKGKLRKRFEVVNIDLTGEEKTDEPGVISISLAFDAINRTAKAFNDATGEVLPASGLSLGYFGESKPRTTTKVGVSGDDHSYCLETRMEKYKHLLAIDTNTKLFSGGIFTQPTNVSVGAALAYLVKAGKVSVEPVNRPFIAAFNSPKPENENWMHLIELLRESCQCTDARKIGIIVDSDLGNLNDYNQRIKPIWDNYYLPGEFELIFASDKVTDIIFNRMIATCHKLSSIMLEKIEKDIKSTIASRGE